MPRPRLLSALFATAFVASALVQASSCALDTNGSEPVKTQEPCESAANCNDNSSCTVDTCSDEKICVYTPIEDGPNPAQTVGDCQRIDCAAGTEVNVTDNADIPDDNEPCTIDVCMAGAPSNTDAPEGKACQRGNQSGTCEMGVCQISCDAQNPCNDSNPCTDDFCNIATSKCVFTNIDGLPTPGATQPPGDCKQKLCVMGKDADVTDDTDVPVDVNPCTENVCTNGTPSNPPTTSGTLCTPEETKVCDGASNCVQCTLATHCIGIITEDECTKADCVNNACVPKYMGTDTTASPALQTAGNCKKIVCNGNGGTTEVNDDTDKPNDNNACTTDTCSSGTGNSSPVMQGTACGMNQVCNSNGGCVGCNTAADCQGADDFCKKRTCVSNVCGVEYTPNNTALPNGQTEDDCKRLVCDGAGNTVTVADPTDPKVDGIDCTQDTCNGTTPSNPNQPSGTACNQNGGDVCNSGGQCKKSPGKSCANGSDCASTFCNDAVCCSTNCNGTCRACNLAGSLGTCSPVPKGQEDAPSCTGASSCDGTNNGNSACKKDDGQGCGGTSECVSNFCVDGRCCESSCTTTCQACNVMANEGKCVNIPSGQPDVSASMTCTNGSVCNGSGGCKGSNGTNCNGASDCLSNFCVDGVCCGSSSCGACQACNVPGMLGSCSNVPSGQDDGPCSGDQSCDGNGGCKTDLGKTCMMASQCLSTNCVDSVCCNSACTGTCQACNVSGSVGMCSNIPSGTDDNFPVNACVGNDKSCDGMGECKGDLGGTCASAADCLNAPCVDGVCCESECDTTCFSCNQAGNLGQCEPVAKYAEDTFPANACVGNKSCDGTNDGANACKLDDGQNCSSDSDCVSNKCPGGNNCMP
ncbi:hypothetical protein [Polyangium sorediatum]|uniref:Disintegrin domain-containing protein n=1 Tax=Polyangium sorediatum TaxID=889274 RepID=A0ABT6NYV0_9BACT|nr:hypothetical protein [Polyangium sorediatum]MDI1433526.1 hypothetical protein [Polyangium sorediatum]